MKVNTESLDKLGVRSLMYVYTDPLITEHVTLDADVLKLFMESSRISSTGIAAVEKLLSIMCVDSSCIAVVDGSLGLILRWVVIVFDL